MTRTATDGGITYWPGFFPDWPLRPSTMPESVLMSLVTAHILHWLDFSRKNLSTERLLSAKLVSAIVVCFLGFIARHSIRGSGLENFHWGSQQHWRRLLSWQHVGTGSLFSFRFFDQNHGCPGGLSSSC